MTFAVIILIIVACAMFVLVGVIAKLLRSDDFLDDDVIATYEKTEGLAPTRMARVGGSFCLVYEDKIGGRYGMGLGTALDELNLMYSADNGGILGLAGETDYVVWSELNARGLTTKVFYLDNDTIEDLCLDQDNKKVTSAVGVYGERAYFAEMDQDGRKVNLVEYDLVDGSENVLRSVPIVDGVDKPIITFKITEGILNAVVQDLVSEYKLVTYNLGNRTSSETTVGIRGISTGDHILDVDKIVDIAPNIDRLSYMVYALDNGKGAIYEVSSKKAIKCAMVDDKYVKGSLLCASGFAYWIEDNGDHTAIHGYNSKARQHIINIKGVTSFIMEGDFIYYFHHDPETGKLALCKKHAAGRVSTLDMAKAKEEYKAEKEARKAAKKLK